MPLPEHEQKQAGARLLHEAWTEARLTASRATAWHRHACFWRSAELVSTYGEEAAARYAENLAPRIRNGEFSDRAGAPIAV